MRIDIPLLPIRLVVARRRLPPSRLTIRGLMLAVAVAGVFLGLSMQLGRLGLAHQDQARRAANAFRSGDSVALARHSARAREVQAAHSRLDILLFLSFGTIATLAGVALLGRALDRPRHRRRAPARRHAVAPSPDIPMGPRP